MREYITVKEAAKRTKVSRQCIRDAILDGRLQSVRLIGNVIAITIKSIKKFKLKKRGRPKKDENHKSK